MTFRIKKLCLIIIFIFVCNFSFAISPTGSVLSIGQSSEIGRNIFPISSYITYNVYDFNFIEKYPTNMTFDITGGYGTRSVSQDPISGLASGCENFTLADHNTYLESPNNSYGIVFSGWEMKFTQPLPLSESIPGKISSWISTSGHYEQAVDLLQNYRNLDPYSSTIFNELKTENSEAIFYGIPELTGNRYIHDLSLNLGFLYTHSILKIPYSLSLTANMAPRWLLNNLSPYGGHTNYFKITPTLYASKSIYSKKYNDLFTNKEFRLISVVLSNSLTYRYLNGTAVPQYKVSSGNLRHDINNTFALNIYGPQFIAEDCYPFIKLYYYSDYKWGKLNNTDSQYEEYFSGEFSHRLGSTFDLRIIGIIHIGYELKLNLKDLSISNDLYFYVQL